MSPCFALRDTQTPHEACQALNPSGSLCSLPFFQKEEFYSLRSFTELVMLELSVADVKQSALAQGDLAPEKNILLLA